MIQLEAPEALDGAIVIKWMWSGEEPFGYMPVVDSDNPDSDYPDIEIYGLAICQYENSPTFYRFSCDKNWEVQNDASYNSIEAAMIVSDQYKNVEGKWLTK